MRNKIGIAVFMGLFGLLVGYNLGTFLQSKSVEKPKLSELQRQLQAYEEAEATCGELNVEPKCKDNECEAEHGFTCESWNQAVHPEKYK